MDLARVGFDHHRSNGSTGGHHEIIAVPVLRRLLSAIHFRDPGTLFHSRRVGLICVGIAQSLGWEVAALRTIEVAALLHDLGKVGSADHVLQKPGRLSADESEYVATHHRVAIQILQACRVSHEVLEIIADAHGVGDRPEASPSMMGPLGARILAAADAYDSLTNDQAFRSAFPQDEALRLLTEKAGKQFDRNVVAALKRWIESEESQILYDTHAAEVSMQSSAPVDDRTILEADCMALLFNFLYLLESLYDGFYLVDSERNCILWSTGAETLFGVKAAEAMAESWSRARFCKPSTEGEGVEDQLLRAMRTGKPQCGTLEGRRPTSSEGHLEVQSIPIRDESRGVCGVLELVCDSSVSRRNRGQFRELQLAATRDPLTGVFNRGQLEERLQDLHRDYRRENGKTFSVVYVDLDHFKAINDRLSHSVGDQVLVNVARLLEDELYSGEMVGRYGGEEFVVICPETNLEVAVERAERLRRAIMGASLADREDLRVTASLGVAEIGPKDSIESLKERADAALYDAKRQGRNRTCVRRTGPESGQQKRVKNSGSSTSLIHTSHFATAVAADMLVYKLKGFVEDQGARLVKVTQEQVVMQVGNAALFGGWGRATKRQPVRLTVDLETNAEGGSLRGSRRVALKITVEPIGRPATPEAFHFRARDVVERLRGYCVADTINEHGS